MAFWHARLASNVIILYVVAKNGECWRKESMDHWIHFTETITYYFFVKVNWPILEYVSYEKQQTTVIFVQKIFEGNDR